ncbi:MAG: hypothetical protein ACREM2_07215 [Vulcanimicrobiaceae bacterium]
MRYFAALLAVAVLLSGCREVRVKSYAQGTTIDLGGNQVAIVRDRRALEEFGIEKPVRFRHEFGVLLLMGPHRSTGWSQVIESIRANPDRVRIVAFERAPADGGDPSTPYRTYTLWIVPNSVYRAGSVVDVVTPDDVEVARAVLR